jgi:hypothetical protein
MRKVEQMNTRIITRSFPRQLARRVTGGLEITLYWNADNNVTTVDIHQPATEETISFAVAADRALEAFYHPFAHLAEQRRPLPYGLQLN